MLHLGSLLLALSLGLIYPAVAQNCSDSIRGLVEDTDGETLPGATIYIESLERGVASGEDGKFVLEDLCPGSYTLTVRFVGYEDHHVSLRVPSVRPLVIKLKPSVEILHDIVVQSHHSRNHSMTQSLSILSEEQILSSRGKPLGELVQQIPGVQSIMTGGSIFKPVIHGLYGQRLLILNNNLRQEGQQWGLEHAPEIDTYIASEIEVVKGSEAVRYGSDALGGAIIINTSPLHFPAGISAELNAGLSSNNRSGAFSGMLEGSLRKHWAWRIQGTAKKSGDYHAPDYNLSNTGAGEFDMSATVGFAKDGKTLEVYGSTFNSEIGILRSAHVGNLNDLQQSIVSEEPWFVDDFTYDISNPRQKIGHHLIKVSGGLKTGETNHLRFIYGTQYNQRKEFDVRRGDQSIPSLSFELLSHSLDLSYDHGKGNWSGSIGATGIFKDNYNNRGNGLIPDYRQVNAGVFAIEKWRQGKWLLEGGLRLDRQYFEVWTFDHDELINPDYTLNYLSASAGATRHVSNSSRISTNLGMATRPPHISELFSNGLHHSAASIEAGLLIRDGSIITDPAAIRKEKSFQWVNTFQYLKKETSLELTVYGNYFQNYVYLVPAGTRLTIRGFFPVFEYRQTDALLAGTDVSFSQGLNRHFSWSSKFSYVVGDDRRSKSRIPFIPPAQLDNSITYKKSKIGKWTNFYVSVAAQNVFEQTRAPRTILPRDIQDEDLDENFDFMAAPESYVLFRVEAGSTHSVGNRDLSVSISAENLFDQRYRNYMNRLRYYADEAGRNISVRVNYKFHSHN
jgi:iron complex outermembrane receptor protein